MDLIYALCLAEQQTSRKRARPHNDSGEEQEEKKDVGAAAAHDSCAWRGVVRHMCESLSDALDNNNDTTTNNNNNTNKNSNRGPCLSPRRIRIAMDMLLLGVAQHAQLRHWLWTDAATLPCRRNGSDDGDDDDDNARLAGDAMQILRGEECAALEYWRSTRNAHTEESTACSDADTTPRSAADELHKLQEYLSQYHRDNSSYYCTTSRSDDDKTVSSGESLYASLLKVSGADHSSGSVLSLAELPPLIVLHVLLRAVSRRALLLDTTMAMTSSGDGCPTKTSQASGVWGLLGDGFTERVHRHYAQLLLLPGGPTGTESDALREEPGYEGAMAVLAALLGAQLQQHSVALHLSEVRMAHNQNTSTPCISKKSDVPIFHLLSLMERDRKVVAHSVRTVEKDDEDEGSRNTSLLLRAQRCWAALLAVVCMSDGLPGQLARSVLERVDAALLGDDIAAMHTANHGDTNSNCDNGDDGFSSSPLFLPSLEDVSHYAEVPSAPGTSPAGTTSSDLAEAPSIGAILSNAGTLVAVALRHPRAQLRQLEQISLLLLASHCRAPAWRAAVDTDGCACELSRRLGVLYGCFQYSHQLGQSCDVVTQDTSAVPTAVASPAVVTTTAPTAPAGGGPRRLTLSRVKPAEPAPTGNRPQFLRLGATASSAQHSRGSKALPPRPRSGFVVHAEALQQAPWQSCTPALTSADGTDADDGVCVKVCAALAEFCVSLYDSPVRDILSGQDVGGSKEEGQQSGAGPKRLSLATPLYAKLLAALSNNEDRSSPSGELAATVVSYLVYSTLRACMVRIEKSTDPHAAAVRVITHVSNVLRPVAKQWPSTQLGQFHYTPIACVLLPDTLSQCEDVFFCGRDATPLTQMRDLLERVHII